MATNQNIKTPVNKAMPRNQPNAPPLKKIRVGGMTATIWENTNKELQVYQTISFERNYKDKDGNWQTTNAMRVQDLPKGILALQKAFEFCVIKENNTVKEEEVADE